MFTGIIEEKGVVAEISHGSKSCRITICAEKILDDVKIGDSIAVNGACLTVAELSPPCFTADVMAETVRRTGLRTLVKGCEVNLERAMMMSGRFGGHIVTGHIDGIGTITNMTVEENAVIVRISAEYEIIKYIVKKGSIALDGISLTVAEVGKNDFMVSVIPHTARETTLLNRRVGDKVNIECDIIGKYIERLNSHTDSGITMDFLTENGF